MSPALVSSRRSRARALSWVGLLLAAAASGCLDAVDTYYAFDPDPQYKNPGVFPGNYSQGQSMVLQPGYYKPTLPEVVQLRSDRPAYPTPNGVATTDGAVLITMAIWRPENITERVPIIIDAGPYFEIDQHCENPNQDPCKTELINDTIDTVGQTTRFSLTNFLPHGYAVVQLAVRGTGTSGGCMDLMGDDEKADLDQALTWLGEQPWSNGHIAMWGVSYDGSTPWTAAATGNPYLKTIVPISGLPDIYDLMFHNGSAETRGAIMHATTTPVGPGVYWGYGFRDGFMGVEPVESPVPLPIPLPVSPPWDELSNPLGGQANGREDYQSLQNLICEDAPVGQVIGQGSVATGNRLGAAHPYWVERDHRDDVLNNYTGSVFLIHGLQDWNVDPHAAIPFNQQLREAGIEMKEWYGQWDHARPDSNCATIAPKWASLPCRLDVAEILFRWFERYLKDNLTVDVGPAIQVQDNVGQWRNADAYPYTGDAWTRLHLTAGGALSAQAEGSPTATRLMPPVNGAPAQIVELRSEPMAADLHLSGLPQLDLPFQVYGQGGQIGAWLFDEDPDGNVRAPFVISPRKGEWVPVGTPVIGHAQLNLLYHQGGETMAPAQPGQTYTARIEFEPLEVLVPAGHRLLLWIFQYQYGDHFAAQTMAPVDIFLGGDGAVLRLPTPDVDPTTVFPVPGSHFPDRDLLSFMYVAKPVFPPTGPMAAAGLGTANPPVDMACPAPTAVGLLGPQSTRPACPPTTR